MASYTDAISQFNPYIQQLPVELMAKVGMQKQAQYDQGVQKIQSYIDNVAGLQAARPQDKAYLESKLNKLGNDLSYVAAGDFSNQQLVNSVGGMASEIIKDPYIQATVYSSAQIKKNSERMTAAEKEGKLAPENVDLYQTELNKYMNGELGDQFDGKYVPYVDVAEHLKEVAKSTGIDEYVIPELFETANGKVVMQRDPVTKEVSPKINKVMAERHIKGKTAEKLLAAFNNSLTPAVKRQLAITGMYENKSLTPEMLAEKVRGTFTGHIDRLKTEIARINVAESISGGSEYDPEKLQILQKAKEDAVDNLGALEKQRDEASNINYVTKNANSLRANLYSTNYLQGMAAQMKEVSDITEYKINPWFDVTMKENDYALKLKTEARQANEFTILRQEHANDKSVESAWRKEEFFGKFGYYPGEQSKKPNKPTLGPIDKQDYEGLRSEFEGGYLTDVETQNALGQKLGLQWMRSLNPNMTNEQLMKNVQTWTGGKEQNKTAMMNRFAGKLIESYIQNPRNISPRFHQQIETLKALNNSVSAKGDAIRDIEMQAKAIAQIEGIDYKEYEEILKSVKPLSIQVGDRKNPKILNLTKEDVIDAVKTTPRLLNLLGRFNVDDNQKIEAAASEARLIRKYGIQNYQKLSTLVDLADNADIGAAPGDASRDVILSTASLLRNSAFAKVSKIKGELYSKSELIPRKIIESVPTGTDNKEIVSSKINDILSKYTTAPNLEPSFDYANYVKVANGDKAKTNFEVKQINGKMQYTMVTTSKEGNARAIVEPEDYENVMGRSGYKAIDLDPMFLKLNTTGTTDKNGIPWFSGRSFPLLADTKYKKTTGNLVVDNSNPDIVWFELNVPGRNRPITFPDPISYPNGLSKKIGGKLNTTLLGVSYDISPAVIDELIQKNK